MDFERLSGDLKDPSRSLPKGTLLAVLTALSTYLVLFLTIAGAFPNEILRSDLNVFRNSCLGSSGLVVLGAFAASFTAALGNLFGGARVLQAVARDNLFPILKPCAYGSRHGDEPRISVIVTFALIQCGLFIGNLDVLAPFITAVFCFSYALINLACFVLSALGTPNFRPSFRHFSSFSAFLGE